MSYSPPLSSGFAATQNRSRHLTPCSGMCSMCVEGCPGECDIGLAAVLGAQSVYPLTTGANQIASEKDYPLDFSAFNLNGRVFGPEGGGADGPQICDVRLETGYGVRHRVRLALPVILPAVIKLNWQDYFSGAAMAGVSCVVGEGSCSKDPALRTEHGRITDFPFLGEVLERFSRYDRGFGVIAVQCNVEDDRLGVPEIALEKYGAKAIEFKFGQAAKGTQPAVRLRDLESARQKKAAGAFVRPDPDAPETQERWRSGTCPSFYAYDRLPQWDEAFFARRLPELRALGLETVSFKAAGYDPADLERILRIACANGVDLVTFDGAGGGTGRSPAAMMNEWGLPTAVLEGAVVKIARRLRREGLTLPAIAIAGGFSSEDRVFKALALGDGLVTAVGMCRAPMAAAMVGKTVGDLIRAGTVPERYRAYGTTAEEIFADLPDLRALYGREADRFPTGAVGVFSYLNKIAFGLRHFGALNRKFDAAEFSAADLIPLTPEARTLL